MGNCTQREVWRKKGSEPTDEVSFTDIRIFAYLADLLDSLVGQEQPFEIIIVDSLSTDNTADIILSYSSRFPFIRLIQNAFAIASPSVNNM